MGVSVGGGEIGKRGGCWEGMVREVRAALV
jgi:hypothetical protein